VPASWQASCRVVSLLLAERTDLAVGFGLFAVLSITRLRSSAITQEDVGYYFVALALGLVNGIAAVIPWLAVLPDTVLLGVKYAADHPRLSSRIHRWTSSTTTPARCAPTRRTALAAGCCAASSPRSAMYGTCRSSMSATAWAPPGEWQSPSDPSRAVRAAEPATTSWTIRHRLPAPTPAWLHVSRRYRYE
jgi:Domain of unknown function (DUF4956)